MSALDKKNQELVYAGKYVTLSSILLVVSVTLNLHIYKNKNLNILYFLSQYKFTLIQNLNGKKKVTSQYLRALINAIILLVLQGGFISPVSLFK